ncbi:MAG: hypothetical protein PHV37_03490 [Candidatus Gastranaerophilales bacterium]|nr:hypothetical protein [Candidatus Gastranaerophilales bacterium]
MKKFLSILIIFFLSLPANATTLIVKSTESFSTVHPKSNINLKVVKAGKYGKSYYFEKNSIIYSTVVKVTDPKRGKQNAYFVLKPTRYSLPSKGKTIAIKNPKLYLKVVGYKPMDKKETAIKAGATAGGFIVTGFTQVFWFGKGVIKPKKNKNRISSGVESMYKNSPLVYIEKGNELIVHQGDLLKIKFYKKR